MRPSDAGAARRGRPRSVAVDRALADAALQEFVAFGYRDMSMESIAARAGVSKVSLYKRWGSKLAVVADVLASMSETMLVEDHGTLEADVRALLGESIGSPAAQTSATVLMRTMGEISGDSALRALYTKHLLGPRFGQLRGLVERAHARGELREDLAIDVAASFLDGASGPDQTKVFMPTDGVDYLRALLPQEPHVVVLELRAHTPAITIQDSPAVDAAPGA